MFALPLCSYVVYHRELKRIRDMRKITTLAALLLLSFSLFASVQATGAGKTENDAYADALKSLCTQVSVSFTGIEYTSLKDGTDGLSTAEYSTKNLSSSSVEFIGLESTTKKTGDGFEVTLVIPDSAFPLYEAKLNELEVDINTLKGIIDSGDDTVKLKNLPSLYKLVSTYEAFRYVATKLNSSYKPKTLSTGSSTGIKTQYSALYTAQSQKDNLTLQQYNYEVALGIISAESEKNYQKILGEIEERQDEYYRMKALMEDSFEQKALELELQISSMRDTLQQTALTSDVFTSAPTLSALISSVEAYRQTYQNVKNDLDENLSVIEKEYNRQKKEVVKKALTLAVTDSDWEDGHLKTESKYQLEKMVRKEVETLHKNYSKDAVSVYGESFKLFRTILKNARKAASDVSSRTIEITSVSDPGLSISVDTTSFAYNRWQAKVILSIYDYTVEVPFSIDYEKWTGSKASLDTLDERISFNKVKDAWESLLKDYANEAMEAVLTVKVEAGINSEGYKLSIVSYKIINTSTGKTVTEGKTNIQKMIILDNSPSFMDFSLNNDLLLLTAEEAAEGEDWARYYRILTGNEKSSLGNYVIPDYKGFNSKDDATIKLYRENNFYLTFCRSSSNKDIPVTYNMYDDVKITFDSTQLSYAGSTSYTEEKSVSTSRVGKLYYIFDNDEIFHLYDIMHTWKTWRFQHDNEYYFSVNKDALYGSTDIIVVLMDYGSEAYTGNYTVNVIKPYLEEYVRLSTTSCRISPTQNAEFYSYIANNALIYYGAKDIDGVTIVYDESKYSVAVKQIISNRNYDEISPLSQARDGSNVTVNYPVDASSDIYFEVSMKKGAAAGKDTIQLWYTLDGNKASGIQTVTLEASSGSWN